MPNGILYILMKQYFRYPLENLNEYERVKEAMALGSSVQVTGLEAAGLSHMISGLNEGYKQKVVVTFDALKAQEVYEDLKSFGVDAVLYPSKDFLESFFAIFLYTLNKTLGLPVNLLFLFLFLPF